MLYRYDLVFLLIFVIVSGVIFWLTLDFPDTGERFGPAAIPLILAVLLMGFSTTLIIQWIRAARHRRLKNVKVPRGFPLKAVLFSIAIATYATLLSQETALGFPGMSMLFLFGTGFIFGGRSPFRVGLVAVITSMGLYLFFRMWLHVLLPRSAWF
jgi:riboflavin transporter FmnP